MPSRLGRTNNQRQRKARLLGQKSSNKRMKKGTTPSIPATGPMPASRFGFVVEQSEIIVPANLK